jgi:nucleoside 2-deoxyribosyltransferase
MSNGTSIRCFVAMAVGRPDTDRVYDKLILPTLRSAGIHPIFMGRLEHNDDIDKRIIQEIEACDFAIADLTYARPSVYFEAGYAQRKVPVIYTAREDHLSPQADDKLGNLRVHFDLLMRNIVPWSSATDRHFAKKLGRRITVVIAPIVRDRESKARIQADQLEFQSLAVSSRIDVVGKTFREAAKRRGYVPLLVRDDLSPWVGRLPGRDFLNICEIIVQPSFTKRNISDHVEEMLEMLRSRFDLEDVSQESDYKYQWHIKWGRYKIPTPSETKNVKAVVARLVLCSLQKVPRGRAFAALPHFTPNEDGSIFSLSGQLEQHPISFSVHVVDPILSVTDASEKSAKLNQILKAQNQSTPTTGIESARSAPST